MLNPILNTGIQPESPVEQPSLIGTLGGLVNLGLEATFSKPTKPSARDIENATLSPFVERLNELKNSDLSDADFQRHARVLARRQIAVSPADSAAVNRIVSEFFGVTPEVLEVPVEDALTESRNAWAQTAEGQSAAIGSIQIGSDGILDDDATNLNFFEAHAQSMSEQAALERQKRKLDGVENDVKLWKGESELGLQQFIPMWSAKSQKVVDGLISSAIADPGAMTPEEQLNTLRQTRRLLVDEFRAKAQAANMHPSVIQENIDKAVAPIDNLISTAEALAGDTATLLNAYKNIKDKELLEMLNNEFGPLGNDPNFTRSVYEYLRSEIYDREKFKKFIGGMTAIGKEGNTTGFSFVPNIPATPREAANPAVNPYGENTVADIRSKEKETPGHIDSRISASTQSIASVKDVNVASTKEVVYRDVANITASAEAADGPLSNAYISGSVFTPDNIRKFSAIVATKDQTGVELKSTLSYFAATQIRRNQQIMRQILDFMGPNAPEITTRSNGQIEVLTGNGPKSAKLKEAVDNINKINASMSRIFGDSTEGGKDTSLGWRVIQRDENLGALFGEVEAFVGGVSAGIKLNTQMNPLVGSLEGASAKVRPDAVARMDAVLAGPFQKLQAAFGKPLTINDAIAKDGTSREKETPGSRHFHGDALDISTAGMSDEEKIKLVNDALAAGFQGFGFGKNILHIDMGAPRGWAYGNDTFGGVKISELISSVQSGVVTRPDLPVSSVRPGQATGPESDPSEGAPTGFINLAPITRPVNEDAVSLPSNDVDTGANPDNIRVGEAPTATESAVQTPPTTSGEGDTTASQKVTQEDIEKLSEQTRKILEFLDIQPNEINKYNTREEVDQAIQRGEVKKREVILLAGELDRA